MIENVWYVWKMKYLLFFCRVPIKFCAPIATMIMGRREKLLVRAAGYQLSKGSACLVQALINSLSGLKMVCRVKLFHGDSKYLLFLRKIMMWWHQLNTMYVNKKQSLKLACAFVYWHYCLLFYHIFSLQRGRNLLFRFHMICRACRYTLLIMVEVV